MSLRNRARMVSKSPIYKKDILEGLIKDGVDYIDHVYWRMVIAYRNEDWEERDRLIKLLRYY